MKVKLLCRKEIREQILKDLRDGNISIDEDADFVLYEANPNQQFLLVKDQEDYIRLAIKNIIYIESISQEIWIHTNDKIYQGRDT
ncbi:hypothetical protein WKT02_09400 [Erysipelotrichaceae bacterium HCN-30851]